MNIFFWLIRKEKICSWWSLRDYNQLRLIQTFNFSGKIQPFFQLLFPEFNCYLRTTRAACRQSGGTAAEGFSAFVSRPWWRHHWVQPAINSVMRSSCIHPFISSSSLPTFCFLTFYGGKWRFCVCVSQMQPTFHDTISARLIRWTRGRK